MPGRRRIPTISTGIETGPDRTPPAMALSSPTGTSVAPVLSLAGRSDVPARGGLAAPREEHVAWVELARHVLWTNAAAVSCLHSVPLHQHSPPSCAHAPTIPLSYPVAAP